MPTGLLPLEVLRICPTVKIDPRTDPNMLDKLYIPSGRGTPLDCLCKAGKYYCGEGHLDQLVKPAVTAT